MHLNPSMIVSPKSGQTQYKGIDEFCVTFEVEILVSEVTKKCEVKLIYPFFQYGEYENMTLNR